MRAEVLARTLAGRLEGSGGPRQTSPSRFGRDGAPPGRRGRESSDVDPRAGARDQEGDQEQHDVYQDG